MRRCEVKELQHVVGISIPLRQWRQIEPGFDEFQDGSGVPGHMRYKVRLYPG